MKLLFDQNLSPKLATRLGSLFPGSAHVLQLGLDQATDDELWGHARDQGFTIVTKDADFDDMGVLRGAPPEILWLQVGNCKTAEVEDLLRTNQAAIEAFDQDPTLRTLRLR